jgi:PhnB protein
MSKQYLGPYLNLQGRAREAMEHYHKMLGGKLELYALDAQGSPKPAGPGDRIVHSRLESDGVLVIASDGHPNYPPTVGDNMAICLRGTDRDRLAKIFNGLAEGGRIKGPIAKGPWGGDAGWVTDKFGINWVIEIDKA